MPYLEYNQSNGYLLPSYLEELSNPGEGMEGEKLRLAGDLVVAKVRRRILDC